MRVLLFLSLIGVHCITHADEAALDVGIFYIEPFGFYDSKGNITGITSDLIKAIEAESGITLRQHLLPYKRMIQYIEDGKLDFSVFFQSELSLSLSESVAPLYDLRTVVVGKRGTLISTYEDLYSLKLATPTGVKYTQRLDDDRNLNTTYVMDYDNAVLMLENDYVDAIIAPEKILHFQLKKLGVKKSMLGDPYELNINTAWLQFSNESKHKGSIPRLKAAIKRLKDEKRVDSILLRYFP